jgi:sugar lactone lactonase YvrE
MHTHFFVVMVSLLMAAGTTGCKKDMPVGKPQPDRRWMVSTIAGDGDASFADGAAATAKFHFPNDVAVAADGSLFVSDGENGLIRKIAGGQVSSFAGGAFGIVNEAGSLAQFKFPTSLALDDRGNIFSADARDPRIRKINPSEEVTSFAGGVEEGFGDGLGSAALFRGENKVATDGAGVVFISDAQNNRIRKIIEPGLVSTLAGTEAAGFKDGPGNIAAFDFPYGIAIDKYGNVFISDGSNFCIRKISPDGQVSTFAGKKQQGHEDGEGGNALFEFPGDMVIDQQDNIYVIDVSMVRKISPQGIVSTIAGSTDGFQDGEGASAKFYTPYGLGIDTQGNIYVADTNNNRIRKISFE